MFPNLKCYWLTFFSWTQKKIFRRMLGPKQLMVAIDFHKKYYVSQWLSTTVKYFLLCSTKQRYSYKFGTTWGWGNDEKCLFFGRTKLSMLMQTLLWFPDRTAAFVHASLRVQISEHYAHMFENEAHSLLAADFLFIFLLHLCLPAVQSFHPFTLVKLTCVLYFDLRISHEPLAFRENLIKAISRK